MSIFEFCTCGWKVSLVGEEKLKVSLVGEEKLVLEDVLHFVAVTFIMQFKNQIFFFK